jgi:type I restriction enzyme S subunit
MIASKVKSKYIFQETRFNAGYFLNDDAVNSLRLEENAENCVPLSSVATVWNPPIFKRQFCQKTERSVPYCQSSDVSNSFEGSEIYINKAQATKVGSVVEENQILVTGFGTIGNTRLVNELSKGISYANNVCRIQVNKDSLYGYIYAVMTSKYGRSQLNKNASGSVVRYIEAPGIKKTFIPTLTRSKQLEIHNLIVESSELRVEANNILRNSQSSLKSHLNIRDLESFEYEYFGNHYQGRQVSAFKRNLQDISATTINAFNYSKRIEELELRIKSGNFLTLSDCLDENQFFSSGSFKRLELKSPNSIKLINQSDIFHARKVGKNLARKFVKADKLVEYGEVIIASVGTLGEGETFCRSIFANEELTGQLISGEFIRMKTNNKIPSGYLFIWLSSDYGFRFIRKTQTGTKLCRPIQKLLKELPVPVLEDSQMNKIDEDVKKAHNMMFQALCKENMAIDMVEKEIESWQK